MKPSLNNDDDDDEEQRHGLFSNIKQLIIDIPSQKNDSV